jgi:hypothetical protein
MTTNPKGYMKKYYHENEEKFNNPKEKKKRAKRNAARRTMEKAGMVHKHDGKEVDHKKSLKSGGSNKRSNLRVLTRKQNRSRKK